MLGIKKQNQYMNQLFSVLDQISLWKSFYSAWLRFLAFSSGVICVLLVGGGMRRIVELQPSAAIGLCLFNLGLIGTCYVLVHLLWHRSNSVRHLHEDAYPVLRITSHLARIAGEAFAVVSFGIGISAGIAIFFAGHQAMKFTFGYGYWGADENVFFDGALTIIAGLGYGVIGMLLGRMFFEMMVIMIDVAQNIRRIRILLMGKDPSHHEKDGTLPNQDNHRDVA